LRRQASCGYTTNAMKRSSTLCVLVLAALVSVPVSARTRDKAKQQCKKNCNITMRSCKQDCQLERPSGRLQESYRYKQCDQGCHDTYADCTSQCEGR
jgi:hypothetical protein